MKRKGGIEWQTDRQNKQHKTLKRTIKRNPKTKVGIQGEPTTGRTSLRQETVSLDRQMNTWNKETGPRDQVNGANGSCFRPLYTRSLAFKFWNQHFIGYGFLSPSSREGNLGGGKGRGIGKRKTRRKVAR